MLLGRTEECPKPLSIRWPIHPQPIAGESLSSWLLRCSFGNRYSLHNLLTSHVGELEWRRKDLDLLTTDYLKQLASMSGVADGESQLNSMILTQRRGLFGLSSLRDRRGWMRPLWALNYCPECMRQDTIPYHRLIWRLSLIPICVKHELILQKGCWNCFTSVPIGTTLAESNVADCSICHSKFCDAPSIALNGFGRVLRLAVLVERLISERNARDQIHDWPYPVSSFFSMLRLSIRLANSDKTNGRQDSWRRNNISTLIALDNALYLLEDWPHNISKFVEANQFRFNRLILHYGAEVPKPALQLLKKPCELRNQKHNEVSYRVKQIFPDIALKGPEALRRDYKKIEYVVQELRKVQITPSFRNVSRIARVKERRLANNRILSSLVRNCR